MGKGLEILHAQCSDMDDISCIILVFDDRAQVKPARLNSNVADINPHSRFGEGALSSELRLPVSSVVSLPSPPSLVIAWHFFGVALGYRCLPIDWLGCSLDLHRHFSTGKSSHTITSTAIHHWPPSATIRSSLLQILYRRGTTFVHPHTSASLFEPFIVFCNSHNTCTNLEFVWCYHRTSKKRDA